jgi:hypothetical protein
VSVKIDVYCMLNVVIKGWGDKFGLLFGNHCSDLTKIIPLDRLWLNMFS